MLYKDLKLSTQAYRIFTLYPDLDIACRAALKFVGTKFPGDGDVLINEMVRDAFAAYRQAEIEESNPRHAFVRGLCGRAIYLYKIRYCAGRDQIKSVWVPMLQEIPVFEHAHTDIAVINDPDPQYVSTASAERLFAARILQSHLYDEVFIKGEPNAVARG